jgi:prevent-host-death family protein
MDRAISASDANQRFSEVLRDVQAGETFVVMSRGRAVAKVMPVDAGSDRRVAVDALLEYVAALPERSFAGWRREHLYE